MDLSGRAAIVTGAGRGIGRAIALALGARKARLTLVARSRGELDAVAAEVRAAGGAAHVVVGDVRDRGLPARAVSETVSTHGGLDILVNNAGVGGFVSVADTTDEQLDAILDTNFGGVFRLTRAALPHLGRKGGHVFMISSLSAVNANANLAAYSASKAALDQFAHCLMLEVRHEGIKVTTIAPGSVDTGFGGGAHGATASDWALQPDDVAAAVIDLLGTRALAHLSRVEMRPLRPPKR